MTRPGPVPDPRGRERRRLKAIAAIASLDGLLVRLTASANQTRAVQVALEKIDKRAGRVRARIERLKARAARAEAVYAAAQDARARAAAPEEGRDGMTLRTFFDTYYVTRFLTRRGQTRKLCVTALNHLRTFHGRDPLLSEISALSMSKFIDWLAARPGRSEKTALKNYRHAKAICAYAAQLTLMSDLPRMRFAEDDAATDEAEADVPAFTVAEIEAMLASAATLTGRIDGLPENLWWVSLILVLYTTGLRIRAARCLRWQDYDDDGRFFRVRRQTQKQRKTQLLGVTRQTAELLEILRAAGASAPDGLIWPWPLDRTGSYRSLHRRFRRQIMKPAGVFDIPGKVFHRLRESCATELKIRALKGILPASAATEQLGHSREAVTDEHYIAASRLPPVPLRHCDTLQEPQIAAALIRAMASSGVSPGASTNAS